jgi:hypothetical protein
VLLVYGSDAEPDGVEIGVEIDERVAPAFRSYGAFDQYQTSTCHPRSSAFTAGMKSPSAATIALISGLGAMQSSLAI